jgi:uncharacterized Rossmann fold enzyme
MTPSRRAAEIVSSWPSDNYVNKAARPTIERQIEEAIKAERIELGERIVRMIENDEKIGIKTKELVTDIIRSNYTPVCIGEL